MYLYSFLALPDFVKLVSDRGSLAVVGQNYPNVRLSYDVQEDFISRVQSAVLMSESAVSIGRICSHNGAVVVQNATVGALQLVLQIIEGEPLRAVEVCLTDKRFKLSVVLPLRRCSVPVALRAFRLAYGLDSSVVIGVSNPFDSGSSFRMDLDVSEDCMSEIRRVGTSALLPRLGGMVSCRILYCDF